VTFSQLSSHALDAFRAKGRHGRTDTAVWLKLTKQPQPSKDIARQVHKGLRTVEKALVVLARKGLAEKVKGGWIRGPKHPEQVAYEQGSLGTTEKRRRRHVANSIRNARFHQEEL